MHRRRRLSECVFGGDRGREEGERDALLEFIWEPIVWRNGRAITAADGSVEEGDLVRREDRVAKKDLPVEQAGDTGEEEESGVGV